MMSVEAVHVKARKREEQNRLRELRDALSSFHHHIREKKKKKTKKRETHDNNLKHTSNDNRQDFDVHPEILRFPVGGFAGGKLFRRGHFSVHFLIN